MNCANHPDTPTLPLAYCGGGWFNGTICQKCIDRYEGNAMGKTGKTYIESGPQYVGWDGRLTRDTVLK